MKSFIQDIAPWLQLVASLSYLIMIITYRSRYHVIERRQNKEDDAKFKKQLEELENRLFEFEE